MNNSGIRKARLRVSPLDNLSKRERRAGYLFIFPALVFMIGFVAYPIIYNLLISFQQVDVYTLNSASRPFVGFENYREIFDMPLLYKATRNTLYFTVMCIILQFTIGFGLAMMFSKKYPGSQTIRGMLLVCWLIPTIVIASVWQWMYAGDTSGILNFLLLKSGLVQSPIKWMTSANGAMWSLIITNVWKGIPFNMLLLSTALTTLPEDVMEAALIDGASKVRRFIHITLPMMRAAIVSVITLGFIYTFKTFELVYIMTNGGPLNSTDNLATLAYRLTFKNFNVDLGASVANVMMAILIIFGILNQYFLSKDEVIS